MNDWSTLKKLIWMHIVKGGGGIARTVSGPIVHITNALARAVKSLTVNVEPVQAGSGDPSPTNVRPISGWTGANVTRTGKNLLSLSTVELDGTNKRTISVSIGAIPPGTYRFSAVKSGTATGNFGIQFIDSGSKIAGQVNSVSQNVTLTAPAVRAYAYMASEDYSDGKTLVLSDIQLELGSTASVYEPYQGNTYTIQLGDTVYGGTLDVTSGVLTVTMAIVDLGTLTWRYVSTPGNSRFWSPFATKSVGSLTVANAKCSIYKTDSYKNVFYNVNDKTIALETGENVVVYDSAYSDPAVFKSAMAGVQLVYELATPIEITLTPTQIVTLLGQNNIWADTGDVTVTYYASA